VTCLKGTEGEVEGGRWLAPHLCRFTPERRAPLPTAWSSGPIWKRTENRAPPSVRTPVRPSCRESLYALCCPGRPSSQYGTRSVDITTYLLPPYVADVCRSFNLACRC